MSPVSSLLLSGHLHTGEMPSFEAESSYMSDTLQAHRGHSSVIQTLRLVKPFFIQFFFSWNTHLVFRVQLEELQNDLSTCVKEMEAGLEELRENETSPPSPPAVSKVVIICHIWLLLACAIYGSYWPVPYMALTGLCHIWLLLACAIYGSYWPVPYMALTGLCHVWLLLAGFTNLQVLGLDLHPPSPTKSFASPDRSLMEQLAPSSLLPPQMNGEHLPSPETLYLSKSMDSHM